MAVLKDVLSELQKLDSDIHHAQNFLACAETRMDRARARREVNSAYRAKRKYLASINPNVSTTGEAGVIVGADVPA